MLTELLVSPAATQLGETARHRLADFGTLQLAAEQVWCQPRKRN